VCFHPGQVDVLRTSLELAVADVVQVGIHQAGNVATCQGKGRRLLDPGKQAHDTQVDWIVRDLATQFLGLLSTTLGQPTVGLGITVLDTFGHGDAFAVTAQDDLLHRSSV
jgi:hypothetical protein